MTPDPADKSLLRCTLRKSADVFAKLVLYASYAVCGITAAVLAVYGMFALGSALANPIRIIITAMWDAVVFSGSLAAAIPWYVYVGIAAVAAIPVYSLLWCIARELTEEDWGLVDPYERGVAWYELPLIPIALVPLLIEHIYLGCTGNSRSVTKLTYFFSFPDAYLHYRKRIKEERK